MDITNKTLKFHDNKRSSYTSKPGTIPQKPPLTDSLALHKTKDMAKGGGAKVECCSASSDKSALWKCVKWDTANMEQVKKKKNSHLI